MHVLGFDLGPFCSRQLRGLPSSDGYFFPWLRAAEQCILAYKQNNQLPVAYLLYKVWGYYNKFATLKSLGVYYYYVKMPRWGCEEHGLENIMFIPPASTKLKGGYTGITLSVCPTVDRIVSALYLQQYSSDPFHICTSYQATSEGVLRVMPIQKFKNLTFWRIF